MSPVKREAPALRPAARYVDVPSQTSPSELSKFRTRSREMLNGSPSSQAVISLAPRRTASASSSYWLTTDMATTVRRPATTTSPTISASAAAGRWAPTRCRTRRTTGINAGASVRATIVGSTIILRYQSSANTAAIASTQTSSRHDQPAARSSAAGTGPIQTRLFLADGVCGGSCSDSGCAARSSSGRAPRGVSATPPRLARLGDGNPGASRQSWRVHANSARQARRARVAAATLAVNLWPASAQWLLRAAPVPACWPGYG